MDLPRAEEAGALKRILRGEAARRGKGFEIFDPSAALRTGIEYRISNKEY
jgi:hypothetical protein